MPLQQTTATTGQRRYSPYLDIINAQLPYLQDTKRLQQGRDLQEQQFQTQNILRQRAMVSDREAADRAYGMEQEMAEAQRKQNLMSTGIGALGTLATISPKVGGYAAAGAAENLAYQAGSGARVGSSQWGRDLFSSAGIIPMAQMGMIRRSFGEEGLGSKLMDVHQAGPVVDWLADKSGISKLAENIGSVFGF